MSVEILCDGDGSISVRVVSDSRSDIYIDEIVVRTRVELDSMASRESVTVA